MEYGNKIVDLFAGPGGWSLACKRLGLDEIGIEFEKNAVATREANGFKSILGSVTDYSPAMFPMAKGLIASPPCFAAGTPVLTKRGSVSIEDVRVGDEVWTHMNRWRPVTATMSRESELVQVGPITTTPDHPFYSRVVGREYHTNIRQYRRTLGEPEWTPAAELQGRFVCSPLAVDAKLPNHWVVDPWLAGRYVADGWVGRDGLMIAVGAGKESEFETQTSYYSWAVSESGPSCRRYTTPDHQGAAWLVEHFGKGAHGKTLPTFLLAEDEGVRARFLAGYLSGDGSRTTSGWRANTVSTHLASQLRLLGISLGYGVSVVRVDTAATSTIEGRVVNQSPYWGVSINNNDGRYTVDDLGMRWFKQRKTVQPAGSGTVYDVTVEEDHSFTAWGYVVHNCQTFSMAGKGAGRAALDDVLTGASRLALGAESPEFSDERTGLVLEPLRWALEALELGRPFRWIALEQVPTVLPVWQRFAEILSARGYSVAVGNLQAEQYGVPQTRKRAILIASLDREVSLPVPTHSKYYPRNPQKLDDGVLPWVSMAEALGWGMTARPSFTVTGGGAATGGAEPFGRAARESMIAVRDGVPIASDRSNYGSGGNASVRGERPISEPAFAVTSKVDRNVWLTTSDGRANATVRHGLEPAPTITGGHDYGNRKWLLATAGPGSDVRVGQRPRPMDEPSATITGAGSAYWVSREPAEKPSGANSIKVTQQEAAALQSFPHDFVWKGSKSRQFAQIGNAVPPLFAWHILRQVL